MLYEVITNHARYLGDAIRSVLNQTYRNFEIIVDLKKKKPNQMETGLGFSTDEGPRVQWNWERPWVNDAGHRFTSQIKVAQKTQTADFNYIIP